jgi:hypothetical protein
MSRGDLLGAGCTLAVGGIAYFIGGPLAATLAFIVGIALIVLAHMRRVEEEPEPEISSALRKAAPYLGGLPTKDEAAVLHLGDVKYGVTAQSKPEPALVPVTASPSSEIGERKIVDVTPEYLIGFFNAGHTSVQAKKLAEAFIGKWMKVSGLLGDVLGNYPSQRMVVFSDRSSYKRNSVNMFFYDKERFGELSTLKLGDTITVIGQLSDVNSFEISLHNCELLAS